MEAVGDTGIGILEQPYEMGENCYQDASQKHRENQWHLLRRLQCQRHAAGRGRRDGGTLGSRRAGCSCCVRSEKHQKVVDRGKIWKIHCLPTSSAYMRRRVLTRRGFQGSLSCKGRRGWGQDDRSRLSAAMGMTGLCKNRGQVAERQDQKAGGCNYHHDWQGWRGSRWGLTFRIVRMAQRTQHLGDKGDRRPIKVTLGCSQHPSRSMMHHLEAKGSGLLVQVWTSAASLGTRTPARIQGNGSHDLPKECMPLPGAPVA